MSENSEIEQSLRETKEQLERMRGQLQALSKAVWQDIDHDDPVLLEAGVRFKQGYNERRTALQDAMDQMLDLLRAYSSSGPGAGVGEHTDGTAESAAVIASELAEPPVVEPVVEPPVAAGLEKKVPFGFVLGGQTYTSASAWPLFYEALLQELYGRAPEKLSRLADAGGGFQQSGRLLFSRVPDPLGDPLPVADAIYAEADLPPEALLQVIKRLIEYMGYSLETFKILLKEKNRGTVETLSIAA